MKEISGDIGPRNQLSYPQKAWYLLHNLSRGVWGQLYPLSTRFWHSTGLYSNPESSPGRQYLDAFLMEELPKIIPPGTIRILDVGCGSGYVRDMLGRAGYSGEYVGIDVVKDSRLNLSPASPFDSTFVERGIEQYEDTRKFHLVISNTALEHIQDDTLAVRRCVELTAPGGVQVHIVPAFWSLFAYLWHGYRQYTRQRIAKVFKGQHYSVYRLGGLASFLVHLIFITVPERIMGEGRTTKMYLPTSARARYFDKIIPVCNMFFVIIVDSAKN